LSSEFIIKLKSEFNFIISFLIGNIWYGSLSNLKQGTAEPGKKPTKQSFACSGFRNSNGVDSINLSIRF
jgi:hypothetical protein